MEAPELERRLVAILAADVEGYSRLMHTDEEATMSTLSARWVMVDSLISAPSVFATAWQTAQTPQCRTKTAQPLHMSLAAEISMPLIHLPAP